MKEFIRKIILKQKAKKLDRTIRALNLKQVKSALILYNATKRESETIVRNFARYLKEEGVKIESIGYYKRKSKKEELPPNELGYYYFDTRACNWLGIPVNQELNNLISKEHHLLIDLNFAPNFALRYFATLSNANFKIGKAGTYQDSICDMTIATEIQSLDYLIEQMKVYLKMINATK
mgnify:CR=1 FL=1|tara:strand:- start:1027 stop:1560 length:534 start_codon:yes stop_codon:yes gene_type:complete